MNGQVDRPPPGQALLSMEHTRCGAAAARLFRGDSGSRLLDAVIRLEATPAPDGITRPPRRRTVAPVEPESNRTLMPPVVPNGGCCPKGGQCPVGHPGQGPEATSWRDPRGGCSRQQAMKPGLPPANRGCLTRPDRLPVGGRGFPHMPPSARDPRRCADVCIGRTLPEVATMVRTAPAARLGKANQEQLRVLRPGRSGQACTGSAIAEQRARAARSSAA